MTSAAKLIDQIDRAFGSESAPGRIGVAVSGGSDSLALLSLLHDWGRADLSVATVDHGLRATARAEAEDVARICADLGWPHAILSWSRGEHSGNLQASARAARFRLLADWARTEHLDAVALGHTMDDQAETFVMRLAREAGVDGLSGMDRDVRRHGILFRRPLLGVRRSALRDYLRQEGRDWIEDPSNEDMAFDRVRTRKALSVLEELGIGVEAIASTMGHLKLARSALQASTRDVALADCREDNGDLVFASAAFQTHQPEIARRLAAAAVMWVGGGDYPPRRLAQSSELLPWGITGRATALAGCVLTSDQAERRISREHNAVKDLRCRTDQLWDSRWTLAGPHAPDLEIRALGEAVKDTPWRETRMPRASLMASPAVWRGAELVAAPAAGLANGWTANATGRGKFADFLLSR